MKIGYRRIDHVHLCIPVGTEDAARRFYSVVLGLKEIEKPESLKQRGGMWFRIGDAELHLGIDQETARTKQHPAFEIEDVATVRQYLEGLGVKTFDEPHIPGRARFTFRDPFSNRIEFLEIVP